jgi:hypothetical protein
VKGKVRKMRRKHHAVQEDLFNTPGEDLRRKVRELDLRIGKALKKKDYGLAKKLTVKQERIIRVLVERGDSPSDK